MARIFLDANIVIDLIERRKDVHPEQFQTHKLFITPLSIHILAYLYKYQMPEEKLLDMQKQIALVPFDKIIFDKALLDPTSDFEDNVQLHSAAEAECEFFLTEDKKLLDMKFFGKTRILPRLENAL